ncbi:MULTISPECIES: recombination mediator RecR [Acinetobacter]|uniref:Recombination protein RecR n=2 Tax=Acinetobacter TaxID=469 RepID=A0A1Z9YZ71_9GAMM|nr:MULTISPECIES: recombination mediator RecR [Acinetobacter]MCH4248204.1 recombination mediator RecR [Acinetobacter populi]OUY07462.1 recombination protein RecR [Acinetobacter populi]SNX44149.1 DNA replication and repair protein RecR [Acinetobacter puyangensis]
MYSDRFNILVQKLRLLPSVGSKSAQRMALHLLMRQRTGALELAQAIQDAVEHIHECSVCHALTELEVCEICQDSERDDALLCVVESPADVFAIEHSGSFKGKYHVLHGHLSPLDGIGPEEVGIPHLLQRLSQGQIKEVILATNATVEGQATAHYLVEACKHLPIRITRIAQGVPQGGELEYVDSHTLHQALTHRLLLNQD